MKLWRPSSTTSCNHIDFDTSDDSEHTAKTTTNLRLAEQPANGRGWQATLRSATTALLLPLPLLLLLTTNNPTTYGRLDPIRYDCSSAATTTTAAHDQQPTDQRPTCSELVSKLRLA